MPALTKQFEIELNNSSEVAERHQLGTVISSIAALSHTQNTDTGTNQNTFSIGDGGVGSKSLLFNRGANNPGIRWSEADSKTQYTHDGTNWMSLGLGLSDPGADRMVFWDSSKAGTEKYEWLQTGNSIAITATTIDTIQDIRTTAEPMFGKETLSYAGSVGSITTQLTIHNSVVSAATLIGTGSKINFTMCPYGSSTPLSMAYIYAKAKSAWQNGAASTQDGMLVFGAALDGVATDAVEVESDRLTVYSTNATNGRGLNVYQYYTGSGGPFMTLGHARGTRSSPVALNRLDALFQFNAQGWNGVSFSTGGQIIFKAMEAFVGMAMATSCEFYTAFVGDGGAKARLCIHGSNGYTYALSYTGIPTIGGFKTVGAYTAPTSIIGSGVGIFDLLAASATDGTGTIYNSGKIHFESYDNWASGTYGIVVDFYTTKTGDISLTRYMAVDQNADVNIKTNLFAESDFSHKGSNVGFFNAVVAAKTAVSDLAAWADVSAGADSVDRADLNTKVSAIHSKLNSLLDALQSYGLV